MNLKKAYSQAKKLLQNRRACDLVKPWPFLYIVWSIEEWDRPGEHYHIATEHEMENFYCGCEIIATIEL